MDYPCGNDSCPLHSGGGNCAIATGLHPRQLSRLFEAGGALEQKDCRLLKALCKVAADRLRSVVAARQSMDFIGYVWEALRGLWSRAWSERNPDVTAIRYPYLKQRVAWKAIDSRRAERDRGGPVELADDLGLEAPEVMRVYKLLKRFRTKNEQAHALLYVYYVESNSRRALASELGLTVYQLTGLIDMAREAFIRFCEDQP